MENQVASRGDKAYISTNIILTFRQRFDYAISEFGYNFIYYWISAFMMIFFTDVIGIAAATVSLLTLVVRVFDAVNDPFIGSLADRSHFKSGRYKPWVRWGAVVMSILIIILFACRPGWSYTAKMVYMWVVYIAITVASTSCNMPFGALNGVITGNGLERQKLSSLRMVFANFGAQVAGIVAVPLIVFFSFAGGSRTANGYFFAVLLCTVIGLPTLIYTSYKVKEVVLPPPDQIKIPVGKQLKTLIYNKYIFLAIASTVVLGFNAYGRMAILMYYFIYYAENPGLMAINGIVSLIGVVIGTAWLGTFIYTKVKSKGKTMMIANIVSAVWLGLLFFCNPNENPVLFWLFVFLSMVFYGSASGTSYALIPDAIDYGEYKVGLRCDGFLAAFVSFGLKAGGAIGPAIMLAVIGKLGYIPNAVQNQAVLTTLRACISLIPAACCLLVFFIFAFWDMDEKKHDEIRLELERRRNV